MARRKGQVVTDTIDATSSTSSAGGSRSERGIEEVAAELMARADAEGVSLVGPGGLLAGLTKTVLETALEAEMSEHLGYEAHDRAGQHSGNSRNGVRTKTVLTDIGPVELEVPRDRDASFEPVIVPKRRRRLGGVDQMVCSLSAKGLTHGEISAHLREIYGAAVSKETISRITDRVMEGMTAWQNRPLDRVYPVIFVDAIMVKIREGQVANRPIYVALGVTVEGERDILGLWAGDGGEGAKYWAHVLTEIKNRGVADVCILVCDGGGADNHVGHARPSLTADPSGCGTGSFVGPFSALSRPEDVPLARIQDDNVLAPPLLLQDGYDGGVVVEPVCWPWPRPRWNSHSRPVRQNHLSHASPVCDYAGDWVIGDAKLAGCGAQEAGCRPADHREGQRASGQEGHDVIGGWVRLEVLWSDATRHEDAE